MLNSYGDLTDIGSWYLGGNSTGVIPKDTIVKPNRTATASSTPTYTVPALVTEDTDSLGVMIRRSLSCYFGFLCSVLVIIFI